MKDSPSTKFRVIITDDVEAFRHLLRIALERSDHFEVIGEARNGTQAVELAKQMQPDLVLLDLSMPGLDGLEALSPIQWECPKTKIVILSGFAKERVGPVVKRLGAHGYIEKGMRPEELVRELLEVLSHSGPGGGPGGKAPGKREGTGQGPGYPPRKAHNRENGLGWTNAWLRLDDQPEKSSGWLLVANCA